MKSHLLLFLLSFLCFTSSGLTQSIDGIPIRDIQGPYMELIGTIKVFNPRFEVFFDFGQEGNRFVIKGSEVRDENGDLVSFHSMTGALNFLYRHGYELLEAVPPGDEST